MQNKMMNTEMYEEKCFYWKINTQKVAAAYKTTV